MSVHEIHQWRLPGCGSLCWPRSHDPQTHHDHGYQLGYAQALRDLEPKIVRTGSLVVDLTERRVWVDGAELVMFATSNKTVGGSPRLWALLEYLARHCGRLVVHEALTAAVMDGGGPGDLHAIHTYIGRLRTRLGVAGRLITNHQRMGYRLEQEPPS